MKKPLLFLLFAVTLQLGFSQRHIQLEVNFIPATDTINWNGTPTVVVYDCRMTSDTTDPFNGVINVRRRFSVDTSLRVIQVPLNNFTIGDTANFQWRDTITSIGPPSPFNYLFGDNLLRFWIVPDSGTSHVPDTSFVMFFIRDLNANVNDPALANRLRLYPNPVTQLLHFDFQEGVQKLESIQVSDLSGKVLQRSTIPVKSLDFSTLPSGMYIVEMRYRDGLRGSYRVVRE